MDENQFQDMWNVMRQHNLDLVDDTSSDFKCNICQKILINACAAPCRCMFCVDCIKDYLQNDRRKCPGQTECCDIEEIDFNSDIQVNRVINKRISKLSVKCPNVGCQSQVELNMIGDHLRICKNQSEDCPYLIIGCEGVNLGIDQMRDHLSMEIHSHTKQLINWIRNSQNETKSIKVDIDKLTTIVEKLSKENDELKTQASRDKESTEKIIREIQRKEKENSTELKILNEKLTKSIDELKAETRLDKENREKVIRQFDMKEKENSSEIHRLNDEMCALKNSNRSIKGEVDKLKTKNEEQVSKLNAQVENKTKQIEELKQRCELTESKCEEIFHQSEVEIKVDKISQQCDVMKTETMETSKSIENIREIIDETISAEFRWTIDNWDARLENARNRKEREIFSESFFTHKNGFKFCLALWPAWSDGQMWIVFHIEKGPFDESLRWPFDRDLQLSLMNPQNGLAYKTMTERTSILTGDPTSRIDQSHHDYLRSSLEKPKTERNNGIDTFAIPHRELINHNNEISIKLSIKPPSIEMKTK